MNALLALAERATTHATYFTLRAENPAARAATCLAFARGEYDGGESNFEQFRCGRERGHRFECTGVAYGGDDESYHGEGRCFCTRCGADGDA